MQLPTHEIIPRDYGFCIRAGFMREGAKHFLLPAKFIKAKAMVTSAYMLDKNVQEFHNAVQAGEYEPALLPGSFKLEDITTENLKRAIKSREGVMNVWNIGGKEAVPSMKFYARVLASQVRSTRRATIKGKYHETRIATPEALHEGYIDRVHSDSSDFLWGLVKQAGPGRDLEERLDAGGEPVYVFDIYLAATLWAYAQRKNDLGLVPFAVSDNLMIEGLAAYYLAGRSFYSLNKILVDRISPPGLVEGVVKGGISMQVLRHSQKTRKMDPAEKAAEDGLYALVTNGLKEKGFSREGYCLELRDTWMECVAELWQQDALYVELLFSSRFPPLVMTRLDEPARKGDFGQRDTPKNPIKHLEREVSWSFDLLRKKTLAKLEVPMQAREFGALVPLYSQMVNKYNPYNKERIWAKIYSSSSSGP